ncbi:MAG: 50S ribosomal protein L23 [Spirochaetales bacterium]|nr:MAG: 50S ribosomal protein L23 [Spirochaetales bacterium]
MEAHSIIIAPVVTEKTNALREEIKKKYVFRVDARANKLQIMQAVKEIFSVKPTACHVMNVKSKPRKSRSKSGFKSGRTATWKKAIVTLAAGEKIDIFEGA